MCALVTENACKSGKCMHGWLMQLQGCVDVCKLHSSIGVCKYVKCT